MRFLKFMLLFLFFVVGLVFFIQNAGALSTPLTLKLNIFYSADVKSSDVEKTTADIAMEKPTWQARTVPFYFVIIAAFGIGMLFTGVLFFMSQTRMACTLIARGRRIKTLDTELKRLKAQQSNEQLCAANGNMLESSSSPEAHEA